MIFERLSRQSLAGRYLPAVLLAKTLAFSELYPMTNLDNIDTSVVGGVIDIEFELIV